MLLKWRIVEGAERDGLGGFGRCLSQRRRDGEGPAEEEGHCRDCLRCRGAAMRRRGRLAALSWSSMTCSEWQLR